MQVQLCGVRGSTPAPGEAFIRYGGHTSCVALTAGGSSRTEGHPASRPTLLLDAGTGIREVTKLLGGEPFTGTILLTHLHWDHFHGLPFFSGGDRDDAHVTLFLPDQQDGSEAEEVLAGGMSPPQFPIRPRQLRGNWTFKTLSPGHIDIGSHDNPQGGNEFSVEVREVPHKGGRTFGYRVSDGTSTVAYIPDHCPTVLGPGPEGLGEYHEAALALASGADLLIHDSHLFSEEVASESAWGHAAAEYAVELGRRADVGMVILFHHKPDRTDTMLDDLARRLDEVPGESVSVVVAAEGTIFAL